MAIRPWMMVLIACIAEPVMAAVNFPGEFAPAGSISAESAPPYRHELCLNGRWQFQAAALPPDWVAGTGNAPVLSDPKPDGWDQVPIKIPSPWNANSYGEADGGEFRTFPSYPVAWEKVDMAWLRREFRVPAEWDGQRVILKLDAVAGDVQVRVNGQNFGGHFSNFLPYEVDITDAIRRGDSNELLLGVRAPRLFNIKGNLGELTYPTGSYFGMHIVGVWQDVKLLARPAIRVSGVFVQPLLDQGMLRMEVELRNDTSSASQAAIAWQIKPWIPAADMTGRTFPETRGQYDTKPVLQSNAPLVVDIPAGGSREITLEQAVGNELKVWSPEHPELYGLVIETSTGNGIVDRKVERFGWRQFAFAGRDLHLNGHKYRLKGEITHFMGVPYLSPRHAWAYYRMLKDANVNCVRLHAMPHPKFYLELADEMGMVIVAETGLWGSNCNFNYDAEEFWTRSDEELAGMLLRDRNHPSIVGWSVMNECIQAISLKTSDQAYIQSMMKRFEPMFDRVRELDPTRPYIVGEDHHPIQGATAHVFHYGGDEFNRAGEVSGKPWAITEDTQSNWMLPPYASQWNGDRAFENWRGRMEASGIEAYELITRRQLPSSAFYTATYSVNWYGLKHQPLGHPEISRAPTINDGVFFTAPYQEGKPGMQPERLAPYSTPLNPGYDPAFPLYSPTPYFEAVQAAFAPGGPLPCPWDQRRADLKTFESITPLPTIHTVGFFGNIDGALAQTLIASGVPLVSSNNPTEPGGILLVDAATVASGEFAAVKNAAQAAVAKGGTAILWAPNRGAEDALKKLAPAEVSLTERVTTALLADRTHPLAYAYKNSALYFSEASAGKEVLNNGLTGPLVERGKVILRAQDTDWPSWRSQAESTRNQIVTRSENETKPSGAALVEFPAGNGRWLVTSLPASAATPQHGEMLRTLFRQLGVSLAEPRPLTGAILSADGTLQQALVIGAFAAKTYEEAFAADFLNGEAAAKAQPGTKVGELEWKTMESDADGIFTLNSLSSDPQALNAAAYLSFWVFCPRTDDLLENPRGAKIDLHAASDDGMKIWYNGKPALDAAAPRPISDPPFLIKRLSLNRGWNHFLIKVANTHGDWKFRGRLQCPDPELAPLLETALFPETSNP